MIIRERSKDFVMIAQDDHAKMSALFASRWKEEVFKGLERRASVELAVGEHDRAWIPLDKTPFWNDKSAVPFSFMDFPDAPKLIFYKQGIDEVEQTDPYAAMLCSHHYARFAENDPSPEAKTFREHESFRQMKIRSAITGFSEENFRFHYELLSFCDKLSLFICLNEPGFSSKEPGKGKFDEMACPGNSTKEKLKAVWAEPDKVVLTVFPFKQPFQTNWKLKCVLKEDIKEKGLIKAYQETPMRMQAVKIAKVIN